MGKPTPKPTPRPIFFGLLLLFDDVLELLEVLDPVLELCEEDEVALAVWDGELLVATGITEAVDEYVVAL